MEKDLAIAQQKKNEISNISDTLQKAKLKQQYFKMDDD